MSSCLGDRTFCGRRQAVVHPSAIGNLSRSHHSFKIYCTISSQTEAQIPMDSSHPSGPNMLRALTPDSEAGFRASGWSAAP